MGCQIPYLVKSGYHQVSLLSQRTPIAKVLNDPQVSSEVKQQLKLIQEVRKFAQEELKLKVGKNYTSYVNLNRPYVTYLVRASEPFELKHYTWWFPIVGSVPYKGFFDKEDAESEKADLDKNGYDTFMRGVRAYSTLGWFDDPVISTMLGYHEHDLVNLIIHESVHSTLYINNSVDFNEQLASFVGNKGAVLYYSQKANVAQLEKAQNVQHDEVLFSKFISKEIQDLESWYNEKNNITAKEKKQRLSAIQTRFNNIALTFKTKSFHHFATEPLNNAVLLSYKTYIQDMDDFQKLYNQAKSIPKFIEICKSLENKEDPKKALKALLTAKTNL